MCDDVEPEPRARLLFGWVNPALFAALFDVVDDVKVIWLRAFCVQIYESRL